MTKIYQRIMACLLAVIMMFGVFSTMATPVSAAIPYGNIGYYCNKSVPKSGMLIVGDSRTCQLWDANKNKPNKQSSYNSVWSGHYGYGGATYQIDSGTRKSAMKTKIKNTIKKSGFCDVYVFATVNNYDGVQGNLGSYKAEANRVLNLAKELRDTTAKYAKRTVRPNVYVVSLIGPKGNSNNAWIQKYNSYLKSEAKRLSKIAGFVNINGCLTGPNDGYANNDKLHYNNETLNNIWEKVYNTYLY